MNESGKLVFLVVPDEYECLDGTLHLLGPNQLHDGKLEVEIQSVNYIRQVSSTH